MSRNLSSNEVRNRDSEIKIQFIDVSENKISSLDSMFVIQDDYLVTYQHVLTMDASQNLLHQLPEQFSHVRLHILSYYALDEPKRICTIMIDVFQHMTALTTLCLNRNKFVTFPMCVLKCENLKSLDLSKNQVRL